MKKIIFSIILFLIVLFNLELSKSYALEDHLIQYDFLGSDTIETGSIFNRGSYIIQLEEELYFDKNQFEGKEDVILKLTTLFNKFYYRDLSIPGDDPGILIDEFEFIILDFTKIFDDEIIIIDTGFDEVTLPSNTIYEFRFENTSDFEIAPNDLIYISDYDNPLDVLEINSYYQAWDEYDKNLTDEVLVIDNYSENKDVVGDHEVKLIVKDASGNESEVSYIVRVSDLTAPMFSDLEVISISYADDPFDFNHQLNNLEVVDNVTSRENLNISIIENTYLGNEDKLGTYYITYEAIDEAGNGTTTTQEIKVIDTIPPVVIGELEYTTNYKTWLRPENLIESLEIYDDVDGNDVEIIRGIDEYSPSFDKLGTYNMYYKAVDKSGNETEIHFIIHVVDDIPPKFYINLSQLTTDNITFIDEASLLSFFENQINFIYDDIEIISNDYLNNEDKIGVYQVTLKTTYNNKETYLKGIIRVDEYIEIPIKNANKPFYKDYKFLIGISMGSLLLIGSIIFFIKKKKSHF
ncbi:MAG: hypothetical protein WC907_05875 [Acholeplasmataceae bacterium]